MTDIMVDVPKICPEPACSKAFGHELDPNDLAHGRGIYEGLIEKNSLLTETRLSLVSGEVFQWLRCELAKKKAAVDKLGEAIFILESEFNKKSVKVEQESLCFCGRSEAHALHSHWVDGHHIFEPME